MGQLHFKGRDLDGSQDESQQMTWTRKIFQIESMRHCSQQATGNSICIGIQFKRDVTQSRTGYSEWVHIPFTSCELYSVALLVERPCKPYPSRGWTIGSLNTINFQQSYLLSTHFVYTDRPGPIQWKPKNNSVANGILISPFGFECWGFIPPALLHSSCVSNTKRYARVFPPFLPSVL